MSAKSLAQERDRATMELSAENYVAKDLVTPLPAHRWLTNPWVDKTLAILAVLPFVYPVAKRLGQHAGFLEVTYLVQTLILIGTMAFRRLPVRITTNPYYCAVAFIGSYWGLFVLSVKDEGHSLIAPWTLLLLYPFSVLMDIWGRLSLGRNIGMLPAQRQIVERGAYRWVRHPIYTGIMVLLIASLLRAYSLKNLLLYSLGVFWFVARTLSEEEFLRSDPAYASYMGRVRWRWLPGL
jgi:protein-S-isoprenylcysteine O-methyltransferase Ste14